MDRQKRLRRTGSKQTKTKTRRIWYQLNDEARSILASGIAFHIANNTHQVRCLGRIKSEYMVRYQRHYHFSQCNVDVQPGQI